MTGPPSATSAAVHRSDDADTSLETAHQASSSTVASSRSARTAPAAVPDGEPADAPWWTGAVGYQVYVRSFADSSGNGVGDLLGVAAHLDHLEWLGVDALWLTPFYPSPGHDHGYDVSDYCAVAPEHGTLDDFDLLVDAAHRRGIKVIIDVVPNHTSIDHEWFQQARRGRSAKGRDRYIWADPATDGGPPNNWVSHFGGPAWTLDEPSGQYWCHLFLPEQPDLNWRNPEVIAAFDEIVAFWIDRGVDGFRIDVAYGLIKDAELRDNPQIGPVDSDMDPHAAFAAFDHFHDVDQPDTPDVFRRWRSLCAPRGVALLGELNLVQPDCMARYVSGDILDHGFFLEPVWMAWAPRRLAELVRAMHDRLPDGIAWAQSNHDRARVVGRYGGGEVGRQRALAVSTLFMALGGMPFIYQGEELGISDGVVRADGLQDPVSMRNTGAVTGRDGCRTPMPWDSSPDNGFSRHDIDPKGASGPIASPWIDAEVRPAAETVAGQHEDADAPMHRYRELIALRKSCPDLWTAPLQWLPAPDDTVLALRRGNAAVIANLGEAEASLELPPNRWRVAFTSQAVTVAPEAARVRVPAETSVILVSTSD